MALTKAVPCLRKRSKVCAMIGLHLLAAEDEAGSMVSLMTSETCGDTVAQKALTGTATLSHRHFFI